VVLDASAVVALLADSGELGDWVAQAVSGASVAAPELVLFETANILRRHQLAGRLDRSATTLAHEDLLSLPLQLWPYRHLAERVWELRDNLTVFDASYVSLAEFLGARLVTLDIKLARAPEIRCPIQTPMLPT